MRKTIFDLFTKSPFVATQEHMTKSIECARQLRPLFDAVQSGNDEEVRRVATVIDRLEAETDQLKHELRNHLPKSLFLPVDRRDLLELIHMQDSIADSTQEAAILLTMKKLRLPEQLKEGCAMLVDEILTTCEMASAVIGEMSNLTESAFGEKSTDKILEQIDKLDNFDTKSETFVRSLLRKVFTLEEELGPVDVMLWFKIFCKMSEVANYAERTGSRVRLLIARV